CAASACAHHAGTQSAGGRTGQRSRRCRTLGQPERADHHHRSDPPMRRIVVSCTLLALGASTATSAQVNLLPSSAWGFAPVVSAWHFTTPLVTPGGKVQDAAQAAVPFQVRVNAGSWAF